MNETVSVIVPIFKVEDYLDRCIQTIVHQTFFNLEIILVDDGSSDKCSQICDEWTGDPRIKVIHKANGGLSDARNAGMKIATGRYLSFIDSDDKISTDFFETMLSALRTEGSDIVECGVVRFDENDLSGESFDDSQIQTFETEQALSGLIAETPFRQHVWNKLYKAELVSGVYFPIGKLNEDEFWTYQIFGNAKKVTKLNKIMYYYFQRSTSIMGEDFNIRRLDVLEGKANRQEYLERMFPNLSLQAKIEFYGSCMFAYQSALKFLSGSEKRKALSVIGKQKQKCDLTLEEIKTVRGKHQKYLLLSKINFYLCCKLRAITGVGF